MKILFAALHHAYFRNFDSVVRELAARGHEVHLGGEEIESLGGRGLAERLATECPGVTWDILPSLAFEPWFDAARRMRVALDYVRALDPRYPPKLRVRAVERTARLVRWASRVPLAGVGVTRGALTMFERLMPASEPMVSYLKGHAPDVVVLASLTYSRSQQLDVLKAARSLNIPVAAAVMSWDHLSSKALLHVVPDRVILWNEVQKREAVEMHGIAAERVVITGAQCYDQWFARSPRLTRDEFCERVGLDPQRPFALWVHSALSPTPDPPEPVLVARWIEALRRSADPRLRGLGVLVRPHPERMKEWTGVSLDRFENVAFHGRNPIDDVARDDYFDALYHSRAVIGLVTSAFLEAAVVGRPVLTFTLPEYRMHQEEMIHFQYLMTVAGGLLHTSADIDGHLQQLAAAVSLAGERDERNRRFVNAFIRPAGLGVPATPAFADALERLVREGTTPDPSLQQPAWLRSMAVAAAARSRRGLGRWLLNDQRADASDEHEESMDRALAARLEAKARWQEGKVTRNRWRQRRDGIVTAWKVAKSVWRKARHRAAVTVYRVLIMAGLMSALPGSRGDASKNG